ncbi:hypothetical protein V491_05429 [Pseudogymnoascus sp. VKM F-3775]|nr:hypothetical protein V491_05429 [Pseudogymnoascus sp. VKM F-3775]
MAQIAAQKTQLDGLIAAAGVQHAKPGSRVIIGAHARDDLRELRRGDVRGYSSGGADDCIRDAGEHHARGVDVREDCELGPHLPGV